MFLRRMCRCLPVLSCNKTDGSHSAPKTQGCTLRVGWYPEWSWWENSSHFPHEDLWKPILGHRPQKLFLSLVVRARKDHEYLQNQSSLVNHDKTCVREESQKHHTARIRTASRKYWRFTKTRVVRKEGGKENEAPRTRKKNVHRPSTITTRILKSRHFLTNILWKLSEK